MLHGCCVTCRMRAAPRSCFVCLAVGRLSLFLLLMVTEAKGERWKRGSDGRKPIRSALQVMRARASGPSMGQADAHLFTEGPRDSA